MGEIVKFSLILGFLFSLVAAILLLVTEFGGWYGYYAWYGGSYEEWGSIHVGVEIFGPIIILIAFLYLLSALVSIMGVLKPDKITKGIVTLAPLLSLIAFILVLVGGLAFAIVMSGTDNWWWFGAGFYGGAIGGLLSTIFLIFARLKYE